MRQRLVVTAALIALPFCVCAQERSTITALPTPPREAMAQPLDPAAATKAWLATVPPEQRARSDAYFEGSYWLTLWDYVVAAAISILLLRSRASVRLRDFAERATESRNGQVALYAVAYLLIVWLLSLPPIAYERFFREHQYGMSNQSFAQWFGEQLTGLMVTLLAGAVFLVALYAVVRRAPRTWWIWGSVVAIALSAVGVFLSPLFVEPLFNTYKPLTDARIREPILAMARANQIPVEQVFVVDASRQTKRISANVAGLFGTTRIALNDNLLRECSLPEIRDVMAHEMGHYVLNHITKGFVDGALATFVGFAVARFCFDRAVRRWGSQWGVRGIADPAGLPLLVLIGTTYYFVLTPLSNTVIRVSEREADAFSINCAREPDAMASVALKLGAYRKLDPSPLEEFIFFDHPSGRARIRMAMDWKAANLPAGEAR